MPPVHKRLHIHLDTTVEDFYESLSVRRKLLTKSLTSSNLRIWKRLVNSRRLRDAGPMVI